MALLDRSALIAKFNDPTTGLFKDNTTRQISEQDLRDLVTDLKDSVFFFQNDDSDDIDEGGVNLFFTNLRAHDALINAVADKNIPYYDLATKKFLTSPFTRQASNAVDLNASLRILSAGSKLGIGVSPSYQVDIQAETTTETNMVMRNSAGAVGVIFDWLSGDIRFGLGTGAGVTTHKFRSSGHSFCLGTMSIGEALDSTTHAMFNINSNRQYGVNSGHTQNYHQTIRNKTNSNGEAAALGFGVDNTDTVVGAYIALERKNTNSLGFLHIGNKLTSGSAPVNILSVGQGQVGINISTPGSALDVVLLQQATDASVLRLATTKVNTTDNPQWIVTQYDKTTSNGSATIIGSITVPANTTIALVALVVGRRTGGSAGTAEDGAAYRVEVVVKNVAGTATIIGTQTTTVIGEDQVGWNADWTVVSGSAALRVTGATNNNVSWTATINRYRISS